MVNGISIVITSSGWTSQRSRWNDSYWQDKWKDDRQTFLGLNRLPAPPPTPIASTKCFDFVLCRFPLPGSDVDLCWLPDRLDSLRSGLRVVGIWKARLHPHTTLCGANPPGKISGSVQPHHLPGHRLQICLLPNGWFESHQEEIFGRLQVRFRKLQMNDNPLCFKIPWGSSHWECCFLRVRAHHWGFVLGGLYVLFTRIPEIK